jgi:hypothetical protein
MGQSRPDRPYERFVIPGDRSIVVPIHSNRSYRFVNQLCFPFLSKADAKYEAEDALILSFVIASVDPWKGLELGLTVQAIERR